MKTHDLSPRYNGYSYRYLVERAQPLDLLLFRGGDQISNILRMCQENVNGNGDFSHVGIIVTKKILKLKYLKSNRLYVWESTFSYPLAGITDGVPDVETGKGRFGVQIRDLEEVLNNMVGDKNQSALAWGRLEHNPWERRKGESGGQFKKRQRQIRKTLMALHSKVGSRYFENNVFGMLAALVPCMKIVRNFSDESITKSIDLMKTIDDEFRSLTRRLHMITEDVKEVKRVKFEDRESDKDNDKDKDHTFDIDFPSADLASSRFLFCSEMVAIIYLEMGILGREVDPANVLPTDFITRHPVVERPIMIFPNPPG